jgi:TPR repeat protein
MEVCMPDNSDIDFSSGMSAFEAKHFSRAMQLLFPLALAGDLDAQHRVAIMFQNGLGVAPNPEGAFKWMRSAAQGGHGLAQHGLGFMYLEGDCAEQDGEQALHWFTLAAEQGLAGSQTTIAMMYEEGRGVEKDLAKAKQWYAKAGFES